MANVYFRRGYLAIAIAAGLILVSYWLFRTRSPHPVPRYTLHPTQRNLDIPDARPLSVPLDDISLASIVSDTSEYVKIGVNEGPPHAMFGHIADVALDSFNNVYILDSEYNTVRVYDIGGTYLSSFGRAGNGPGELYEPESISLIDNGNRAVITTGRVTIFSRTSPSTFEFDRTFNVPYPAFWEGGSCSMNGHVYTLDYSPEAQGVIHKYSLDGAYITSFGNEYISSVPFVTSQLSDRGYLACSAKSDVIAWIRRYLPFIHGYSSDGGHLWTFRIQDYLSPGVEQARTEDGRASVMTNSMQEGHSRHMGLHVDDQGHFFASFITAKRDSVSVRDQLISQGHVFRIDPSTEEGSYWATVKGLAAVWGGYLATEADRPHPHVRVYKMRTSFIE